MHQTKQPRVLTLIQLLVTNTMNILALVATMTAITLTTHLTTQVLYRGKPVVAVLLHHILLPIRYDGNDPDMVCYYYHLTNSNFDPATINQTNILNVTKVLYNAL